MKLSLEHLQAKHEMPLLDSAGKSKQLHHPRVSPPDSSDAFRSYLANYAGDLCISFLVINIDFNNSAVSRSGKPITLE